MTAPGSPIPRPAGPIGGKDVTWHRSFKCSGGGCVEAARLGGLVLVRDSKLKGDSPVQEWPVAAWSDLLRVIKKDSGPRPWEWTESFAKVRLTRNDVELTFTAAEWDAFVAGVLAGDFEPDNLVPAAPREGVRGPADEVAAASGHEAAPLNGAPIGSPAGRGLSSAGALADDAAHRAGQPGPWLVGDQARAAARAAVAGRFKDHFGVVPEPWSQFERDCADVAVDAFLTAIWGKAIAPLVPPPAAACSCPGCGTGSCDECSGQCTAVAS